MELKVTATFAGVRGSGAQGTVISVDDAVGKAMLAEGYPVEATEVKANGRKRAAKPKGDAD